MYLFQAEKNVNVLNAGVAIFTIKKAHSRGEVTFFAMAYPFWEILILPPCLFGNIKSASHLPLNTTNLVTIIRNRSVFFPQKNRRNIRIFFGKIWDVMNPACRV